MTICLLPNCAYLSETSRMLEIHRALRHRGVDARVATHGGTYEYLLPDHDVIGPPMGADRSAAFVRDGAGMGDPSQSMYTDDELRTYARAEADYFGAHGVQVAVTGFTLTTLLSTRLAGVRLVTEHAGCMVPPAWEHRLLPAPSRPPQPAFRYAPAPVARWLMNRGFERLDIHCAGFRRVARELGVAPVPSFPGLLMGDLVLVPEAPEVLGIPASVLESWTPRGRRAYWPTTRLRYTGPLFARLDMPLPGDVDEFLDEPGPVIYVAITSSTADLVRSVVAALRGIEARVLVAGTVHEFDDLAADPAVLAVSGVLPSHRVMPRVALAVTGGGQGSVQTALAAGVPLLGIPLQPEQDLNVALAENLGAARRIAPRRAGTADLARLADEMLTTARYREGARRVAELYAGLDGPGTAADAIIGMTSAAR